MFMFIVHAIPHAMLVVNNCTAVIVTICLMAWKLTRLRGLGPSAGNP